MDNYFRYLKELLNKTGSKTFSSLVEDSTTYLADLYGNIYWRSSDTGYEYYQVTNILDSESYLESGGLYFCELTSRSTNSEEYSVYIATVTLHTMTGDVNMSAEAEDAVGADRFAKELAELSRSYIVESDKFNISEWKTYLYNNFGGSKLVESEDSIEDDKYLEDEELRDQESTGE